MAFMTNNTNGGDFDVYVKYNAKAGRWYTKGDEQGAEEYEVTNMTAIFDIENIRTGWFMFAAGVAPVKEFDPSLSQSAPKPGDQFKRGFEIKVYSDKNLGGVREFSSTAGAVIDAMNSVHDQWMAGKDANAGKLPVVQCTGVVPVTGKHGTNYSPTLTIVSWADRPAELSATKAAPAQAAPVVTGPAAHMPPPVVAAASLAAAAGAPDF